MTRRTSWLINDAVIAAILVLTIAGFFAGWFE